MLKELPTTSASVLSKVCFAHLDAYEAAQTRIVNNPLLCSPAHEEPIIGRGLRQVLFKTTSGIRYRVVFIIDGNQVTILRVRGKGQNRLSDKDLPNG